MKTPRYNEFANIPLYKDFLEDAANDGFHDYPADHLRGWYNLADSARRGITTYTFNSRADISDKHQLAQFAFDLLNAYDPADEDNAGAFHVVAYIFSCIFEPDVESFEEL